MSAGHVIVPGSHVKMHYVLRLDDGTVAEDSHTHGPVEFDMGDGSLIPGLERALFGLKTGDRQTLRISPREGYGARNPEHVHTMPRSAFPTDFPVEPGLVIGFDLPDGEHAPGTILSVEGDQVRVDFNHPLAGREIVFDVEVLDVETPVVANDDELPPPEF